MSNNKKPLVSALEAALIAGGQISAEGSGFSAPVTATASVTQSEVKTEDNTEVTTDETEVLLSEENVNSESELTSENKESDLVVMLKNQLSERDDELIEAKVENRTLTKQLAAAEVSLDGLKSVAVKSINAMQVALGKPTVNYDEASAADILASHTQLSADFTANFPVGGVAAVAPNTEGSKKPAAKDSDHMRAARLAATNKL